MDMDAPIAWLAWTGMHMTAWKIIGLAGTLMFAARWGVQVVASHMAGRPVIPRAFWVMSLAGSLMALSYFVFSAKQDAVGVVQNLFPALTAAYSLWLDLRQGRRLRRTAPAAASPLRDHGSPTSPLRPAGSASTPAA